MGVTLLLALLAISLVVIGLGYFLSIREQLQHHDRYTAYSVDRSLPPSMIYRRCRSRYEIVLNRGNNFSFSAIIGSILRPRMSNPTSLLGLGLALITLLVFGSMLLKTLLPSFTLVANSLSLSQPAATVQPTSNPLQEASNASQKLMRISQLDPSQYNSTQEYNLWAYSACSTASMTEVMDAYGRHYRITDVLRVEAQIGAITPQLGLLEEAGIANTASHFGFTTIWGHQFSLDQIIDIANKGRPVIVSWPPDRYDGGHLVVVIGGDSNYVYIADSSLYNRHMLTRAQFLSWWEGFAAILVPQGK